MPEQRNPDEAMKIVAEAQENVIKSGGVIHEESLWDANEMALDGVSQELIERRLKGHSARAYKPRGSWQATGKEWER